MIAGVAGLALGTLVRWSPACVADAAGEFLAALPGAQGPLPTSWGAVAAGAADPFDGLLTDQAA